MKPIYQCIQKISTGNHFSYEIKGHNSNNNQWILSLIKLDLYFMIIYLCMKYEFNTPMFSKDMARKPFFVQDHNSDNKRWILSLIKLDMYSLIIYLCMKYESNRPMHSKDMARKPYERTYVHTDVHTDVRTGVTLHAPPPPPHYKWRGHNKSVRSMISPYTAR